MAETHFSVDFDARSVIVSLRGLPDAIDHPAPLLAQLGEYALRTTTERFRTQTAPDGTAWAKLTPRYQREKPRNKNRILTLNGYLRGQMAVQVNEKSVQVGSNSIYAATHQFGRGAIPTRPYLGLSDIDRNEIVERTQDWLQRQMRG
ncbi:phage virion morphogenesis protein [Simplicispira psychrophila]|uniref:phage virion morphogenesis protein n=1 Tax=Simplicispira psychrophila TaxID=80882 RepID=UPI00068BBA19|nr:phage virion morphogenesis protein [Simplicispira psychrophila]